MDSKQYWVDDRFATRCFACSSKFSMLRRKHHCRQCGQIFCGDCLVVVSRTDKSCKACDVQKRTEGMRSSVFLGGGSGVSAGGGGGGGGGYGQHYQSTNNGSGLMVDSLSPSSLSGGSPQPNNATSANSDYYHGYGLTSAAIAMNNNNSQNNRYGSTNRDDYSVAGGGSNNDNATTVYGSMASNATSTTATASRSGGGGDVGSAVGDFFVGAFRNIFSNSSSNTSTAARNKSLASALRQQYQQRQNQSNSSYASSSANTNNNPSTISNATRHVTYAGDQYSGGGGSAAPINRAVNFTNSNTMPSGGAGGAIQRTISSGANKGGGRQQQSLGTIPKKVPHQTLEEMAVGGGYEYLVSDSDAEYTDDEDDAEGGSGVAYYDNDDENDLLNVTTRDDYNDAFLDELVASDLAAFEKEEADRRQRVADAENKDEQEKATHEATVPEHKSNEQSTTTESSPASDAANNNNQPPTNPTASRPTTTTTLNRPSIPMMSSPRYDFSGSSSNNKLSSSSGGLRSARGTQANTSGASLLKKKGSYAAIKDTLNNTSGGLSSATPRSARTTMHYLSPRAKSSNNANNAHGNNTNGNDGTRRATSSSPTFLTTSPPLQLPSSSSSSSLAKNPNPTGRRKMGYLVDGSGRLDLSRVPPHEESTMDLEYVTYGTHEVPIRSQRNPMGLYLEQLAAEAEASLEKKKRAQLSMLRQTQPKRRFYTALPFVTFRLYETSPNALFFPTSFPAEIMELDVSIKGHLKERYDNLVNMCLTQAERRQVLVEAGELMEDDDESATQTYFDAHGGNNMMSPPSARQPPSLKQSYNKLLNSSSSGHQQQPKQAPKVPLKGIAASIVPPEQRMDVLMESLQRRCSTHLRLRVHQLLDEVITSDPTVFDPPPPPTLTSLLKGVPPLNPALEKEGPPKPLSEQRKSFTNSFVGDGASAAQQQQSPAPALSPTAEIWEEAICDLAWKAIGQTQFIPRFLLPRHYFRSQQSNEVLDHSGWRQHIAIIPAVGGELADTEVVQGVALWQPLTERILDGKLRVAMPRVLLLGGAAVGATPSLVKAEGGLDEYVTNYQGWFEKLYDRIRVWNPSVIVCEGTMHHFMQERATADKIKIATFVKRPLLERLERALGARIIEDLAKVTIGELQECARNPHLSPIGFANEMTIEFINSQPMMMFSGLQRPTFSTIVLRGAHMRALSTVTTILEQVIECAFHLTSLAHFCADFGIVIGPKHELWRLTQSNLPVENESEFRGFRDPHDHAGKEEEEEEGAQRQEAEEGEEGGAISSRGKKTTSFSFDRLNSTTAARQNNNLSGTFNSGGGSSGSLAQRKPSMIRARSMLTNHTIEREVPTFAETSTLNATASEDAKARSPSIPALAINGITSPNTESPTTATAAAASADAAFEKALNIFGGPDIQLELTWSSSEAEKKRKKNKKAGGADEPPEEENSAIGAAAAEERARLQQALAESQATYLAPIGTGGYSRTVGSAVVSMNIGVYFPERVLEAAAALNVANKNLIRDNIVVNVVTLERLGAPIDFERLLEGGTFVDTRVSQIPNNSNDRRAGGKGNNAASIKNSVTGAVGAVGGAAAKLMSTPIFAADGAGGNGGNNNNAIINIPAGIPAVTQREHLFDDKEFYNPEAVRDAKQDRASYTFYSSKGGDETLLEVLQEAVTSVSNYTKLFLHERRRVVMRVMHEAVTPMDRDLNRETFFTPSCYYSCNACERLVRQANRGVHTCSDEEEYNMYQFCKAVSDKRPVSSHALHMSVGALLELMFYANPRNVNKVQQEDGGGDDMMMAAHGHSFFSDLIRLTNKGSRKGSSAPDGMYGLHCGHEMFLDIRPCFEIVAPHRRSAALVSFAVEDIDVNVLVGPSMYMTRDYRFQRQAAAAFIREARRRLRAARRQQEKQAKQLLLTNGKHIDTTNITLRAAAASNLTQHENGNTADDENTIRKAPIVATEAAAIVLTSPPTPATLSRAASSSASLDDGSSSSAHSSSFEDDDATLTHSCSNDEGDENSDNGEGDRRREEEEDMAFGGAGGMPSASPSPARPTATRAVGEIASDDTKHKKNRRGGKGGVSGSGAHTRRRLRQQSITDAFWEELGATALDLDALGLVPKYLTDHGFATTDDYADFSAMGFAIGDPSALGGGGGGGARQDSIEGSVSVFSGGGLVGGGAFPPSRSVSPAVAGGSGFNGTDGAANNNGAALLLLQLSTNNNGTSTAAFAERRGGEHARRAQNALQVLKRRLVAKSAKEALALHTTLEVRGFDTSPSLSLKSRCHRHVIRSHYLTLERREIIANVMEIIQMMSALNHLSFYIVLPIFGRSSHQSSKQQGGGGGGGAAAFSNANGPSSMSFLAFQQHTSSSAAVMTSGGYAIPQNIQGANSAANIVLITPTRLLQMAHDLQNLDQAAAFRRQILNPSVQELIHCFYNCVALSEAKAAGYVPVITNNAIVTPTTTATTTTTTAASTTTNTAVANAGNPSASVSRRDHNNNNLPLANPSSDQSHRLSAPLQLNNSNASGSDPQRFNTIFGPVPGANALMGGTPLMTEKRTPFGQQGGGQTKVPSTTPSSEPPSSPQQSTSMGAATASSIGPMLMAQDAISMQQQQRQSGGASPSSSAVPSSNSVHQQQQQQPNVGGHGTPPPQHALSASSNDNNGNAAMGVSTGSGDGGGGGVGAMGTVAVSSNSTSPAPSASTSLQRFGTTIAMTTTAASSADAFIVSDVTANVGAMTTADGTAYRTFSSASASAANNNNINSRSTSTGAAAGSGGKDSQIASPASQTRSPAMSTIVVPTQQQQHLLAPPPTTTATLPPLPTQYHRRTSSINNSATIQGNQSSSNNYNHSRQDSYFLDPPHTPTNPSVGPTAASLLNNVNAVMAASGSSSAARYTHRRSTTLNEFSIVNTPAAASIGRPSGLALPPTAAVAASVSAAANSNNNLPYRPPQALAVVHPARGDGGDVMMYAGYNITTNTVNSPFNGVPASELSLSSLSHLTSLSLAKLRSNDVAYSPTHDCYVRWKEPTSLILLALRAAAPHLSSSHTFNMMSTENLKAQLSRGNASSAAAAVGAKKSAVNNTDASAPTSGPATVTSGAGGAAAGSIAANGIASPASPSLFSTTTQQPFDSLTAADAANNNKAGTNTNPTVVSPSSLPPPKPTQKRGGGVGGEAAAGLIGSPQQFNSTVTRLVGIDSDSEHYESDGSSSSSTKTVSSSSSGEKQQQQPATARGHHAYNHHHHSHYNPQHHHHGAPPSLLKPGDFHRNSGARGGGGEAPTSLSENDNNNNKANGGGNYACGGASSSTSSSTQSEDENVMRDVFSDSSSGGEFDKVTRKRFQEQCGGPQGGGSSSTHNVGGGTAALLTSSRGVANNNSLSNNNASATNNNNTKTLRKTRGASSKQDMLMLGGRGGGGGGGGGALSSTSALATSTPAPSTSLIGMSSAKSGGGLRHSQSFSSLKKSSLKKDKKGSEAAISPLPPSSSSVSLRKSGATTTTASTMTTASMDSASKSAASKKSVKIVAPTQPSSTAPEAVAGKSADGKKEAVAVAVIGDSHFKTPTVNTTTGSAEVVSTTQQEKASAASSTTATSSGAVTPTNSNLSSSANGGGGGAGPTSSSASSVSTTVAASTTTTSPTSLAVTKAPRMPPSILASDLTTPKMPDPSMAFTTATPATATASATATAAAAAAQTALQQQQQQRETQEQLFLQRNSTYIRDYQEAIDILYGISTRAKTSTTFTDLITINDDGGLKDLVAAAKNLQKTLITTAANNNPNYTASSSTTGGGGIVNTIASGPLAIGTAARGVGDAVLHTAMAPLRWAANGLQHAHQHQSHQQSQDEAAAAAHHNLTMELSTLTNQGAVEDLDADILNAADNGTAPPQQQQQEQQEEERVDNNMTPGRKAEEGQSVDGGDDVSAPATSGTASVNGGGDDDAHDDHHHPSSPQSPTYMRSLLSSGPNSPNLRPHGTTNEMASTATAVRGEGQSLEFAGMNDDSPSVSVAGAHARTQDDEDGGGDESKAIARDGRHCDDNYDNAREGDGAMLMGERSLSVPATTGDGGASMSGTNPSPAMTNNTAASPSPDNKANHTHNPTFKSEAPPLLPSSPPPPFPTTVQQVRMGTAVVPTTTQRFVSVQAMFPLQFAAMRYLYADGCPEDVLVSMLRCEDFVPGSGQSHSGGKAFFKTSDQRYILKQVKRIEAQHFIDMATDYFVHMAQMFTEQHHIATENYSWPSNVHDPKNPKPNNGGGGGGGASTTNNSGASAFTLPPGSHPASFAPATEKINASSVPARHTIQSLIVKVLGLYAITVSVPKPKRRHRTDESDGGARGGRGGAAAGESDGGVGLSQRDHAGGDFASAREHRGEDATDAADSTNANGTTTEDGGPADPSNPAAETAATTTTTTTTSTSDDSYRSRVKDPDATGDVRYFILMENLLMSSKTEVQRVFDLKGSQIRRFQDETHKDATKPKPTFMDENLINRTRAGFFLYVTEDDSSWLKTVFQRDTEFLARSNVMDYSLIAGMERSLDEPRYVLSEASMQALKAAKGEYSKPTLTVLPRREVETQANRRRRAKERQEREQILSQIRAIQQQQQTRLNNMRMQQQEQQEPPHVGGKRGGVATAGASVIDSLSMAGMEEAHSITNAAAAAAAAAPSSRSPSAQSNGMMGTAAAAAAAAGSPTFFANDDSMGANYSVAGLGGGGDRQPQENGGGEVWSRSTSAGVAASAAASPDPPQGPTESVAGGANRRRKRREGGSRDTDEPLALTPAASALVSAVIAKNRASSQSRRSIALGGSRAASPFAPLQKKRSTAAGTTTSEAEDEEEQPEGGDADKPTTTTKDVVAGNTDDEEEGERGVMDTASTATAATATTTTSMALPFVSYNPSVSASAVQFVDDLPSHSLLHLGIIDYLHPYSWSKKSEQKLKEMKNFLFLKLANRTLGEDYKQPTIIEPYPYKQRFERFMGQYFCCVPTKMSMMRKNYEGAMRKQRQIAEQHRIRLILLEYEEREREKAERRAKAMRERQEELALIAAAAAQKAADMMAAAGGKNESTLEDAIVEYEGGVCTRVTGHNNATSASAAAATDPMKRPSFFQRVRASTLAKRTDEPSSKDKDKEKSCAVENAAAAALLAANNSVGAGNEGFVGLSNSATTSFVHVNVEAHEPVVDSLTPKPDV